VEEKIKKQIQKVEVQAQLRGRSGCERAQARISADAAVEIETSVDPVEERIAAVEGWACVD
jgi:hypothetical protein